jgi:hypothetical protein
MTMTRTTNSKEVALAKAPQPESLNGWAESIQRKQWMDSWLSYVALVLPPIGADPRVWRRTYEAAERLLKNLDACDYNGPVRQEVERLIRKAIESTPCQSEPFSVAAEVPFAA